MIDTGSNSHYFISRADMGRKYAIGLQDLRFENTAVLALSEGGVIIGTEIAKSLHALISLLLLRHVYLPDGKTTIGMISAEGKFTYNIAFSKAEITELESEYRNHIEQSKMVALHELHQIGKQNIMPRQNFNGRNVIIVSDFARTGTAFLAAKDFLKPVSTEKIILIAPVATVKAVDIMHRIGDKIIVSHVTDTDFPMEHYYVDNSIPHTTDLIQLMNQIVLQW
jgi:predicted phosphoribosyltransferase